MATANDVALHILDTKGEMGTMKLQKLVFYSQAYSLGWYDAPMFNEEVQAWIHGPVVRDLWQLHKKLFTFDADSLRAKDPAASADHLTERDKLVINAVLQGVGDLSGLDLKYRTHKEAPWNDAFNSDAQIHNTTITHDAMREYYSTHS